MDYDLSWIKIIGVGTTGASALTYFGDVADDVFPERLIVSDKDDVADLRKKISDVYWLFVITDIEDLELAAQIVECIKESRILITFLILCPSAEEARLADIPDNFGTWIILPEDKIAECGLIKNAMIYRTVDMIIGTIWDGLIGMDFADVKATLSNVGKAYVGFGESRDAENNSLQAVKNALKSPLLIEEIGRAEKALLVFFGNYEFLNMMDANEADTFFNGELRQSENFYDGTLFQVKADETAADGVTAFVLATKFDE